MTALKARSRVARWLLGATKVLGLCAAVLALAVGLALFTSWGRAGLLGLALPRVDDALPGSLHIGALERLTPWGVTLSELALLDPGGTEVVRLQRVHAEVDPSALLGGQIVIRALTIGPGHVDSRELEVPGRGLLGALVDPDAPPAPVSEGPAPYLRIDRVRVHGLSAQTPEVAPWGVLEVRDLELSAHVELDAPGPRVRLDALDARILRGGQQWASVGPVTGLLERGGEPSALDARFGAGGASVRVVGRGVLPPAPGFEDSALTGELQVHELRAETLALVLADPSLAGLFTGAIGLELTASGSMNALSVNSRLRTGAGQMQLGLRLEERARLTLTASGIGLALDRFRADLPQQPLSFSLTSSADIQARERIPLQLQLHSAQLGSYALPELDARATWRDGALQGLLAVARRGPSSLRVTGDVAREQWDLTAHADVHEPELRTLAGALGSAHAPGGRVAADLRVRRAVSGVMSVSGDLEAHGLTLAGLTLADADVSLDVAGNPPELGGKVHARLQGMTAGGTRLRHAEIRIEGGPEQYRLRAKAALPELHGAADLRLKRQKNGVSVRGSASGVLDDTPFALALGPTTVTTGGSVDTRGVELRIAGQTLEASGVLHPTRSALVVTASRLDLDALSRLLGVSPAITGRADVTARLSGSFTRPVVSAQLSATHLRRSTSEPLDAALKAELDAAAGQLQLEGTVGPSDAARNDALRASFRLSSSFGPGSVWRDRLEGATSSLQLELLHLDLARLEPWADRPLPASGELGVQLRLAQANRRLETTLEMTDAQGPWLELGAELHLPARDAGDTRALAAVLRDLPANSAWNANATLAKRALDEHWPEQELAGHLDLEGNLSISHEPGEEPAARVSVLLAQNSARRAPAGCNAEGLELALDAELARGHLKATVIGRQQQRELLRASSALDVRLVPLLRGETPLFGAISSQWVSRRLDLQKLPFLCQRLRGTLDAQLNVVDALGEHPSVAAVLTATQLSLGSQPALDVALRAHADSSAARVEADITAPLGRSTLRASLPITWSKGRVSVSPGSRLSAQARLDNLPIAPLLDPAGAVSHARGRVTGEVHVEGPLHELTPRGRVELKDAELTATSLAQPLHGVRGHFAFKDKRLEITGLEARDKDGLLELNGHVTIHGPSSVETQLHVKVQEFPLRQRGQVVATTSGEANIQAQISSARSDIAVKLRNVDTWLEKSPARGGISLDAHPDVAVTGAAKASVTDDPAREAATLRGRAQEVKADARPSRLSLDATDHFWVKREDFAIQLSMHLVAQVGAGQTSVKGRVDLHRGYLDLMGKVFDVRRGSHLEFTGAEANDPVIAIEASHALRSSGKTIHVKLTGRASRPELRFFVDEAEVSAGQALEELVGRRSSSGEDSAKRDAASFVSGLTAGLLATSARRELGAAAPIIMIEPGARTGEGRLRAGFELDSLIPKALASLITGVYLEGIVTNEEAAGQQSSTQAGVLVELYFPSQLFSTGQWGPGATWSIDWGWQL